MCQVGHGLTPIKVLKRHLNEEAKPQSQNGDTETLDKRAPQIRRAFDERQIRAQPKNTKFRETG